MCKFFSCIDWMNLIIILIHLTFWNENKAKIRYDIRFADNCTYLCNNRMVSKASVNMSSQTLCSRIKEKNNKVGKGEREMHAYTSHSEYTCNTCKSLNKSSWYTIKTKVIHSFKFQLEVEILLTILIRSHILSSFIYVFSVNSHNKERPSSLEKV